MNQLSLRQQEIIDTALEIIAENGIENFTIKNLAKARGVSEPALYRHFESKQNILILIISQYRNSTFDLFDQFIESDMLSYKKIESFYIEIIRRFSDKPSLSGILFSDELFRHNKTLTGEINVIIEMMHARIENILKKAKLKKELKAEIPCGDIAWIIMGTMRMAITRWRLSGYTYDPVKEVKIILKSLRKMIYK